MNSNERANRLLDRMEESVGLTPSGRSALIQAANPFSDFEFDRAGFWDSNEAASVVQCVKGSTVVSSTGPGNWDCHIATLPICGATAYCNYTDQGTLAGSGLLVTRAGAISSGILGPVNILTGASGSNLSLVHTTPAVVSNQALVLSLGAADVNGASFLDGTSRVIGMGFEVHNTTAEIYRQGAVAVYKQPQNHFLDREARQEILSFGGTPLAPATIQTLGSLSNYTLKDIPGTLSDALLLSGSRQWEAADGCMVIPTFISEDLQPTRREAIKPIIIADTTVVATLNATVGPLPVYMYPASAQYVRDVLTNNPGSPAVKGSFAYERNKFMNFNTAGAFFTGLSKETTLTVNVIYYIERFPTPAERDLVVIAQPSPKPDPIARLLYAEMMRTMPPGVKVSSNADGDWFYELVSGAAKFLQPALMAAGPLGMAGSALASGADAWAQSKLAQGRQNPPQKKKKKAKKAPPPQQKVVKANPAKKALAPAASWESASGMKGLSKKERAAVRKAFAII